MLGVFSLQGDSMRTIIKREVILSGIELDVIQRALSFFISGGDFNRELEYDEKIASINMLAYIEEAIIADKKEQ